MKRATGYRPHHPKIHKNELVTCNSLTEATEFSSIHQYSHWPNTNFVVCKLLT